MIDFSNLVCAFTTPGEFSPELHPAYYRALYPDLQNLSDSQLKSHYANHGLAEGRSGSPGDLRNGFVACLGRKQSILEIGPFTAPSIRGSNVKYFDVLEPQELRERAKQHGYPIIEPVRIDFVSPNGSLVDVPEGFDAVYSAHALEHAPDLLGNLKEVNRILNKGGVYCLTLPDLRFTFDHFRDPTSLGDVLLAHEERRTVHCPESVRRYYTQSTHNDAASHWRGEHGPSPRPDIAERAALAETELANANGGYVDIHT